MGYLGPSKKVVFVHKSFWRPSEAWYLMEEIESYEKVSACKGGSKYLMFYGKDWENSDENRLTFLGNKECFSIGCSKHLVMG